MNDRPYVPPEAAPWGASPQPPAAPPPYASARTGRPPMEPRELVRRWFLVLALALFAIALLTAFVAANQVVSTWLRHQWVPVARTALALGVAGLALAAVWRLTAKRP